MSERLSAEQRLRIQLRHKRSIERYGYQPEALFWTSKAAQTKRFDVLSRLLPFPARGEHQAWSLLDVGCGFADFYEFLIQRGYQLNYTGLDLSESMIFSAGCLHPEVTFLHGELADFDFKSSEYDYVVLSGALNEVVDDSGNYARAMIKKMYEVASKAVGFNLLNRQDPWTQSRPELQSFYPKDIVLFCEKFAKKVVCYQDYLNNDFTVFLYK